MFNLNAIESAAVLALGILSFATTGNFLLRLSKPKNETLEKVAVIIKSWWAIAGLYLLFLTWYKWGLLIGMFIFTLISIREYLKQSRVAYKKYIFYSIGTLCCLQYLALAFDQALLFLAIVPVLCLWVVPGIVIARSTVDDLELVAGVGFGLALLVYYLGHVAALTSLSELKFSSEVGTYAALILVLITWSNDVFQFIAGKCLGKWKVVPHLSPNKTLAGFLGGLIGTTLLTGFCTEQLLGLSWSQSFPLGVLVGISGMFGDLFFSAVKRRIGLKDFSQAIPGHGGYLDRLDSLIFTAPVYFHYLLLTTR